MHPINGKRILIVISYALSGWLCCLAVMGLCMAAFPLGTALIVHAASAPVLFAILSLRYFRKVSFTTPFQTAWFFTGFVILMDFFVVALLINRSLDMFTSFVGTWLPFALIFLAVWTSGSVVRRKGLERQHFQNNHGHQYK
jgi:hypothetical protein